MIVKLNQLLPKFCTVLHYKVVLNKKNQKFVNICALLFTLDLNFRLILQRVLGGAKF